jgi:hypothetical protein
MGRRVKEINEESYLSFGGKVKEKAKKKPKISSLKLRAWTLFSTYVRLRDCLKTTGTTEYGKCITCGETVSFSEGDAGHFIPRRWNETLFDEKNVHLQCKDCNWSKGGNVHEYRRKIVEMYSEEEALELERRAWLPHKFTVQELQDLIQDIKAKILTLEEE